MRAAQVVGAHCCGNVHTLGVVLQPQTSGAVQVPQLSVPPQPSPAWPQFRPSASQVVGTQVAIESGVIHDARSNIMNSSSFSCAVIGELLHSSG